MSGPPRKIRELREPDHNLVISSWLQSYADSRQLSPFSKHVALMALHGRIERMVFERPELFCVACAEQDDNQVLGWACIEDDTLHYLYIKRRFRKEGIGRDLLHNLKELHMEKMRRVGPLAGRADPFAGAQKLEEERRAALRIPCTHWTIHCEKRNDLQYKPSRFYEPRETT